MAQACKVCSHPEKDTIDGLLIEGSLSGREIAKKFQFSESAIRRHKNEHIPNIATIKAREEALNKKKQEISEQSTQATDANRRNRRTPPTNEDEFLQMGWYKAILKDFHTKINVLYELALKDPEKPKLYAANGTMSNLLKFLEMIGKHLGFIDAAEKMEINIQAQKVELINSQFKKIMEIIKEYPDIEKRVIDALLELDE